MKPSRVTLLCLAITAPAVAGDHLSRNVDVFHREIAADPGARTPHGIAARPSQPLAKADNVRASFARYWHG